MRPACWGVGCTTESVVRVFLTCEGGVSDDSRFAERRVEVMLDRGKL